MKDDDSYIMLVAIVAIIAIVLVVFFATIVLK